jgi:hypothetical protein
MKKELVPIEERRWIAENAVLEMGTVIKYKIMDLDKVVARMKDQREARNLTDFVTVLPLSPDMYKAPNRSMTFQKDPLTGVLYGLAIKQDQFGNIQWQKIQLSDSLPLDLTKSNDAKLWAVLRFSSDIEGSPFEGDRAYYKVFDPVEVAKEERSEVEMMKECFDRITSFQDNPKEMVLFTRFLGEDVNETSNYDVVMGQLLKKAKNYPAVFKKRWESKARSYGEKFFSAKALGIISTDADHGFTYNNIPLGVSEEDVIRFLAKDRNILNAINNELDEKDTVILNLEKDMAVKAKPVKAKAEV